MTTEPTLLISAVFALVAAAVFGFTGYRLGRRNIPSPAARQAWQLFTVWWYGVAATTLTGGLLNLGGAFELTDLPLFVALTYINILFICVALWGLLYYLIYLFTGNSRTLAPLGVFYVGYYGLLVYYITASFPDHVEVDRWVTRIVYRSPISGPIFVVLLLLLVLPQIIGSLVYLTLFFRVRELTQKYRILLVSISIIVWFGSALVASFGGVSQQDWWQVASRFISLGAALTILAAYFPPGWLKRRYGLASVDEAAGE